MAFAFDYVVVGSGFGGAVCALRLTEQGRRVALVEQGRRIGPAEIAAAKTNLCRLLWMPRLGMRGYFQQRFFSHLTALGGVGVGGGSLVWGAVMLAPKPAFYRRPEVAGMGVDWEGELREPLATVQRMLGVTRNPRHTAQDALLKAAAERMGAGASFGPVPSAITFAADDALGREEAAQAEFAARTPCCFCGGCLTGCEYGSKNSLDYTYLRLAERRGARILSERRVDRIEPLDGEGYRLTYVSPYSGRITGSISARRVVLSAGVLGTLELLYKNRDRYRTLPGISRALGRVVRTNSEAITAALHPRGSDMTDGTAISSDFHPDAVTHATQNRFDRGYRFMRWLMVPMTDGPGGTRRAVRSLAGLIGQAGWMWQNWTAKDWEKRISVFTVMQDRESHLSFAYRRRLGAAGPWGLRTEADPALAPPSYLPIANRLTREFAAVAGARPLSSLMESVGGVSATAHLLSGCPMGEAAEQTVIDPRHEVHGYPGLYVVDGSSIPANIGVNPSLTIAAMAERFAGLQSLARPESRKRMHG